MVCRQYASMSCFLSNYNGLRVGSFADCCVWCGACSVLEVYDRKYFLIFVLKGFFIDFLYIVGEGIG